MNILRLLFTFFILLPTFGMQAVTRQAMILYHPEKDQTIYALWDVHADTNKALYTRQHRAGIIAGALMHNAGVIDEDMGSFNPHHYMSYGLSKDTCNRLQERYVFEKPYVGAPNGEQVKFAEHANTITQEQYAHIPYREMYTFSPLYNLAQFCDQVGVPCYNAEFRYPGTVSMFGNYNITLADLMAVQDNVIQQLSQTTNPTFKKYNQTLIQEHLNNPMTQEVMREASQNPDKQLSDVIECENPDQAFNELNVYDAPLLNGTMLNGVEYFADKNTVIICAGGFHIDAIIPVLKQDGFQEVATFGGARLTDDAGENPIIPVVDLEDVFTHNLTTTQLAHGLWNSTKTVMSYLV